MKVSLNWIKDYVDIGTDIRNYTERMTMTGTKVEGYENYSDKIKNIVVGKILDTKAHEDSDHLTICRVDVGKDAPIQIVTGATNIKQNDFIPVCLDGAVLPDGKRIKSGKLRGVLSEGMLCSLGELGLDAHDFPYAEEDGIFILQEVCSPGDDICSVLMLDDTVVDFELTFNRPDCLAFTAIARESAASLDTPFKYSEPECPKGSGNAGDYLSVEIENNELCSRYIAKVIKNVKIGPSPLWLRSRLRVCGIRPINNIVDITNYVMLEYGQPMHAFDYNYIKSKKIVVRNAKEGEKITTLDGNEHILSKSMLCIADGERPVALAGVMGGENSEITSGTTTVVFESANFNRFNIRATSRATGLRTESSRRFEKGLPAYNAMLAINRACQLAELLEAGEIVDGHIDVCTADLSPARIKLDVKRINEILGTNIQKQDMEKFLKSIDIITEGDEIIIPPYRNDIIETADVAEEIARLYGYDKILSTGFKGSVMEGKLTEEQKFINRIESSCVALGFYQTYTYSFISPKLFDLSGIPKDSPLRDAIRLLNPLGDDTSVMRTTALPSLLSSLLYNYNHRAQSCRLFECASVYRRSDTDMSYEPKILCLVGYGQEDFYTIKGYVENILSCAGITGSRIITEQDNTTYHPGRCARIIFDGTELGIFGQIHPSVSADFGFDCEVYAAELYLDKIFEKSNVKKQYSPLPQYPSIERDLSLITESDIEAGTVIDAIYSYGGKALIDVSVFDVYMGKGIPENHKSMAFRLVLRLEDKTMSDVEADLIISKILRKLDESMGIKIRS